jgi:hypothetical protein
MPHKRGRKCRKTAAHIPTEATIISSSTKLTTSEVSNAPLSEHVYTVTFSESAKISR